MKSERDTGVSTNGVTVTANVCCFDGGTFWVLLLTYLYFTQSAGRSAGAIGVQGFQGYGLHLSTNHFVIIR